MSAIATIDLYEDHGIVRRGAGATKRLAIRELIQAINTAAESTMQYSRHESIRMPRSAYLSVYAGNILNLCCYYPERSAVVRHFSRKYEIMLPNVVIHFSLKVSEGGQRHEVLNSFYYCTDKAVDDLPSTIPGRLPGIFTYMPFPNFYDDFRMCFGGNVLLHRLDGGDLRMLNMFYDVIESSPFNDDLRLNGVRRTSDKREWFEFLAQYYKDHKAFPYKELSL